MTLSLALAACDRGADDRTVASDNVVVANDTAADALATDNMAAPALPATAADFANAAAASDAYEIESSKLALDKSKDEKVRGLAQMLVTDHQKSTIDLKAAAAKADPPVTPAPAMNAEQTANIAALRAASDADFDGLYLGQQVAGHEKALALLEGYAAGGSVDSLKEFASKTTIPVRAHLEKARELSH
jgi:putative membrane protein